MFKEAQVPERGGLAPILFTYQPDTGYPLLGRRLREQSLTRLSARTSYAGAWRGVVISSIDDVAPTVCKIFCGRPAPPARRVKTMALAIFR